MVEEAEAQIHPLFVPFPGENNTIGYGAPSLAGATFREIFERINRRPNTSHHPNSPLCISPWILLKRTEYIPTLYLSLVRLDTRQARSLHGNH